MFQCQRNKTENLNYTLIARKDVLSEHLILFVFTSDPYFIMCNHSFDLHLPVHQGFLKLMSSGQLSGFDEFASSTDHATAAAHFLWLAQS